MKIFIVILLSLVIHFLLYLSFKDKNILENTQKYIKKETKDKISTIKYVKIQPKKIKKPKPLKKVSQPKRKSPKKLKVVKKKSEKKPKIISSKKIIKKIVPKITKPIVKKEPIDKLTQSYLDLYGDKFKAYPKETKIYIIKNIKDIGSITKIFLEYPYMSIHANQSGVSVVEFILYPNGTISDLKVIKSSNYFLLDDNTMETIEAAYSDYPRPPKPTIIKIYVKYILN